MTASRKPHTHAIPEAILAHVHQGLLPEGLTHLQEEVLRQCWIGETYQTIADTNGYDDNYIRVVGSQLWKKLSTLVGYKVTKHNVRLALKKFEVPNAVSEELLTRWQVQRQSDARETSAVVPSFPHGQVTVESPFYIERAGIEDRCYKGVSQPGALIRVKASRQMGKTSLMTRIIKYGRKQGYATVALNLELASTEVLSDSNRFFRWLCITISKGLDLPNKTEDYWEEISGGSYNCTEYFERYLLAQGTHPIVLALDNVDVVFNYPKIAANFFGMLRAWFESARYDGMGSNLWQRIRLVVVYSTEVYVPLNIHQSPFNVGMFIELPPLSAEQIVILAERYQLRWSEQQATKLIERIGGNPYLVKLALDHCKDVSTNDVEALLHSISSLEGIYNEHLQRQFWALQPYEDLQVALARVMESSEPITLDLATMFKLEGMGLIRIVQRRAVPACELYQEYFNGILNNT